MEQDILVLRPSGLAFHHCGGRWGSGLALPISLLEACIRVVISH